MRYQSKDVPARNPSFSYCAAGRGRIAALVEGEMKLLQCSSSALERVLAEIDGKNSFDSIEGTLSERYPLDGVRNYLEVLLSENIIEIKKATTVESGAVNVLVAGDGIAADFLEKIGRDDNSVFVKRCSIEIEKLAHSISAADVVIVTSELFTYTNLLAINEILVKAGKPFVLFYCTGKELVAGPFVIPGKTSCLECQVVYHLEELNSKMNPSIRLSIKDMGPLSVSQPLGPEFDDEQVAYIASTLLRDAVNLHAQKDDFNYLENELHFHPGCAEPVKSITYYPTTKCPCCHGMNASYKKWGPDCLDFTIKSELKDDTPILYSVGGMRSCSLSYTEDLIEKAFSRTGLKVTVERQAITPMQQVIPCYQATLSASCSNKTPFRFRKTVTRGKGTNEKQAYLSASFELAERASAQYFGDVPMFEAPYSEVKDYAIDLIPILHSVRNQNTPYEKFAEDMPIDWIWSKSLIDGKDRLVPACMVFLDSAALKGNFCGNGSSGLASGATLEDAVLQGLLEVVEHDAWMIGQANIMPLPIIDYSTTNNEKLRDYFGAIASLGRKIVCRNYTNDIGIPVIRAWIVDPKNHSHYAISGFGASLLPEIALERAVTEAVLSDMFTVTRKSRFGALNALGIATAKDSLYSLSYFQAKDIAGEAPSVSISNMEAPRISSVKQGIDTVTKRLKSAIPNSDVLFVDLTRKVLDVPVVRVLVTGDIQRLSRPMTSISPRMFTFGKRMGYGTISPSITELYLGPYPH